MLFYPYFDTTVQSSYFCYVCTWTHSPGPPPWEIMAKAQTERKGAVRNPAKERVICFWKNGVLGCLRSMIRPNEHHSLVLCAFLNCPAIMDQWFEPMKCCSWGPFARCSRASPFSIADLRVICTRPTLPELFSTVHEWYESYELKQWSLFKLSVCRLKRNLAAMNPPFLLENLTCPQFGSHPHVFPRWLASKLQPNGTSRMKYHRSWTSPDFAYFNLGSTLVSMLPFGKLRITKCNISLHSIDYTPLAKGWFSSQSSLLA